MPDSDTERLAALFQESRRQALRSDCPPGERLWAAAAGELSFEELRQTADHSAGCSECSEALRIALELRRASAPGAALGTVVPLRARPKRWVVLSGAGLLAAGLAAVLLVRKPELPTGTQGPGELTRDVERGGNTPGLVLPQDPSRATRAPFHPGNGSQQIVSETAALPQPRTEVHLRWTAYPGALRYNVSVMTPSFQLLHRATGLSTTELQVPKEALSTQLAGARLLWTVEATTPDGQVVESPLFALQLE